MGLGDALARDFSRFAVTLEWPVDQVTLVPAGRKRLEERGYNQVALLAAPLAARLGKPYVPGLLERSRETRSQVGLNPAERKMNVEGAFRAHPGRTAGSNILLVDDIVTTGSTLAACATALQKAGARNVFCLTVARALPHHGLPII